ncbi:hypothetical protein GM415_00375 [Pseudodesulfovibrio cashew]|uniref:Uncharacterized protein n=1 Tax=Pseudodesulfovibrio cashew TaxID=2678688 RepID=A0A6I6J774_9BACT|nr:hypothetical protein [Pseudodesulfovibrio cashew]QGY38656.1 hypothetical protein GM415_00375 [Pseudodesulfovibrio cashew]
MADAQAIDAVRKTLFRRYLLMLTPAAILFAAWAACRQAGLVPASDKALTDLVGPAAFIAAIVLAVAAPLLYRIRFVKRVEGSPHVEAETFTAFQLSLTSLALLAPYAAAAGYMAGVSTFHFSGAFLAALYGAYYYFPSQKRVAQEMRLFRVPTAGGKG